MSRSTVPPPTSISSISCISYPWRGPLHLHHHLGTTRDHHHIHLSSTQILICGTPRRCKHFDIHSRLRIWFARPTLRPVIRSLRHIHHTCHDDQTPRYASVSHSSPSRLRFRHDFIFAFRSAVHHYAATTTVFGVASAPLIIVHYIIIHRCSFVIRIHTHPSLQYVHCLLLLLSHSATLDLASVFDSE